MSALTTHRSIVGDAFLTEIDEKFSLTICDPPYGRILRKRWDRAAYDRWMQLCVEHSLPDATICMWGGIGKPGHRPFLAFAAEIEQRYPGWVISNWITWKKRRAYGVQRNYLFTREERLILTRVGSGSVNPRPIPGFDGYFASEDGTIWTSKRKGGNARAAGQRGELRPLKSNPNRRGYLLVGLDVDGRNVTRFVHRLILETFVGPRPKGLEACHFPDEDKSNNALSNLRWDTHTENMRDAYRKRAPVTEKVCRGCGGAPKPRLSFYADLRALDGLKTECIACHKATCLATQNPKAKRRANRDYMRRKRAGVSCTS